MIGCSLDFKDFVVTVKSHGTNYPYFLTTATEVQKGWQQELQ